MCVNGWDVPFAWRWVVYRAVLSARAASLQCMPSTPRMDVYNGCKHVVNQISTLWCSLSLPFVRGLVDVKVVWRRAGARLGLGWVCACDGVFGVYCVYIDGCVGSRVESVICMTN